MADLVIEAQHPRTADWTATFTAHLFECKPFALTRMARKRFALALIRKQRFF